MISDLEKMLEYDRRNPDTLSLEECVFVIEKVESYIVQAKSSYSPKLITRDDLLQLQQHISDVCRCYLMKRFEGVPSIFIEMNLQFPEYIQGPKNARIVFETAPFECSPYCVFYMLRIFEKWTEGYFHRNAPHVLQAKPVEKHQPLVFQEYCSDFPHVKYSLGCAGRPGGPQFYISIKNNTRCHGPGSQGSKTNEADGCFGIIHCDKSVEVIERITEMPFDCFTRDRDLCVEILNFNII
tara:strand:+ start:1204 stop:1920 length:717 start_codon:yes stop_codon:yes gene_type:complete